MPDPVWTAVAFHGVRRSGITAGDTVLVQGAGPIGLFALQFARAAGAGKVLVAEPSPARRRLAAAIDSPARHRSWGEPGEGE
jgi:(R,R)-butanediol dehydrogenase/meso-butanediol dehydrogenase/diacetyl reductase